MGMLALGGDNGIDTDHALAAIECVNATVDMVKRFSEGVRDLAKRD